jgi:hypothetical protein
MIVDVAQITQVFLTMFQTEIIWYRIAYNTWINGIIRNKTLNLRFFKVIAMYVIVIITLPKLQGE